MAYEIVPASIHHLEELVSLFDAYRVFYQQKSDPQAAVRFLQQRIERRESQIFIAYSQELNKILGFVQLYPSFSSVSLQRLWILNDLFVGPSFRRKGIAKALMARARELADQTASKGLVLETTVDNQPAQRLYETLGFVKTEDLYSYTLTL